MKESFICSQFFLLKLITLNFLAVYWVQAQVPEADLQLLKNTEAESFTLEWEDEQSWVYFIEFSEDLVEWEYLPVMEYGFGYGDGLRWSLESNAEKLFFRLKYTDAFAEGEDAFEYDFDGDGLINRDELLGGTDPFSNADANANFVPDDWETYYEVSDLSADEDMDGLSALQEYQAGSDPTDYYNGTLPNLEQITSDPDTIRMRVTSKADNSVLVNAPVDFKAIFGGHLLSDAPNGEKSSKLTLRTGPDGTATVYLVAPE